MERECWMRARQMAGDLFDEPDFNTATALMFMSSHALFAKGNREASSYYGCLAETICEDLGFTNSEVYLRVLTFGHLITPTMSDIIRFQEKVSAAQSEPYHFVMTLGRDADMQDLLNTHDDGGLTTVSTIQLLCQRLLSTVFICSSVTRCPMEINPFHLHTLARRLKWMYATWYFSASQSGELKESRVYALSILFATIGVEVFNRLGNHSKSLEWAMLYLQLAQRPLYGTLAGIPNTASPILQSLAKSPYTQRHLNLLLRILVGLQHQHLSLHPVLLPYATQITLMT